MRMHGGGGWCCLGLMLAMATSLAVLASCDSGDDAQTCTPGSDPKPGCSLMDCLAHRNDCSGTVYACGETGEIIELGTCDLSIADAAPGACTPGKDPVPGCSIDDCNQGVNVCGGPIFVCDMTGMVVQNGFCPVGGTVDASVVIPPDAGVFIDGGMMVPPVDGGGVVVDAGIHDGM
jgi:hypothetical protein